MSHAYYLIVKTVADKLFAMRTDSLAAYRQLLSVYDHPGLGSMAITADKQDVCQIAGATVGGRFLDTQGRFLGGLFTPAKAVDGEEYDYWLLCDNPTKSRSAAAIMAQRKGY